MRVYLLRHGIAEERRWDVPDAVRQLTEEGIEEMRSEAAGMCALGIRVDAILTSPLVRARQTAEIVADALECGEQLREEARLGSGFSLSHFRTIAAAHTGKAALMLVGHEPGLSMVAGQLVGGAGILLKKGGLIVLDLETPTPGGAVLRMLLPPAVLIGVGRCS